MAGTTKAVTLLAGALALCAAGPCPAAQEPSPVTGEVMVVEHVDKLILYDKYQQHLSVQARAGLQPFTPLRILKEKDVLGDGFTPCMDVAIGEDAYFVVGGMEDARRSGVLATYRNVRLLSDTVEVLRSRAVSFSPVDRLRWTPMPAGERLLRIFAEGTRTYVRRLGAGAGYGWAALPPSGEGKSWRPLVRSVASFTVLPPDVLGRIRTHLGEKNELLRKLFAFFNGRTGEQKTAPHWELEASGQDVDCVLHDGRGEDFAESTKYLVRDLDDLMLGTGFKATAAPGRIAIRRAEEAQAPG